VAITTVASSPLLAGVEMWRRVICEVHLDHDPVELADPRESFDHPEQSGRELDALPVE
jgi:hypothetical protein